MGGGAGKGRPPAPSSPGATRLSFVATEGADSFYSTKGDFEKVAAAVKSNTAPKAPRFGPTGYEKGGESPGPGSYRHSISSFRQSPNKPLAARAPPPSSPGSAERLKFQGGEGADSFYDVVKIGGGEAAEEKKFAQKTMSRTPRFSKTGYEVGLESPGPGNYSAEKSRIVNPQMAVVADSSSSSSSARAAVAAAASSSGRASDGRLTFSKTEGADSFYNVPQFNQSSSPHKAVPTFSKTPKFSLTGYEKGLGTPGPGNYQPPASPKSSKTAVPSAAFALPHFWSSSQDWAQSPAAKQHSSSMLGSPGGGAGAAST
jgi:hypothetical protein